MLTTEQLTAIYEREMENQPSAGLDVINAKKKIHAALDEYCAALNYEDFLWAYALGYEAGKKSEKGAEVSTPQRPRHHNQGDGSF